MDPSCLTTSQFITFTSTSEKNVIGKDTDEFTLKGALDVSEIHYRNMVALQPLSVSVTNLFYNITYDNNILIVVEQQTIAPTNVNIIAIGALGSPVENELSVGQFRILEFPVGHYTGSSLVRTLNDLLNYEDTTSGNNQIFTYSTTTGRITYKHNQILKSRIAFTFTRTLKSNNGDKEWTSTIWDTLGLDSKNSVWTPLQLSYTNTEKTAWVDSNFAPIPYDISYGLTTSANKSELQINGPLPVGHGTETLNGIKAIYVIDHKAKVNNYVNYPTGSLFRVTGATYQPDGEVSWISDLNSSDVIGFTWKILAYTQHFKDEFTPNVTTRLLTFYVRDNEGKPFPTKVRGVTSTIHITEFEILASPVGLPVVYEKKEDKFVIDETVNAATYFPLPINLIGPETIFISISGVHAHHLCLSNAGTKIGIKRKSIEPISGGYELERQRKDDVHKWLSIPVNAAFGEVISRTFDDAWANSIQFFNRVAIDQEWTIKLYDHQMNLLHLAPNQNLTLCFKKYDSVL
jgi:hypothetical protein